MLKFRCVDLASVHSDRKEFYLLHYKATEISSWTNLHGNIPGASYFLDMNLRSQIVYISIQIIKSIPVILFIQKIWKVFSGNNKARYKLPDACSFEAISISFWEKPQCYILMTFTGLKQFLTINFLLIRSWTAVKTILFTGYCT